MKTIKITEVLNHSEFIASKYPTLQSGNFGYDPNKDLTSLSKLENLKYYITEADSKYNYGLTFEIYVQYKINGINFLRSIVLGSGKTISSAPREIVEINGNNIFFTGGFQDKTDRDALVRLSSIGIIFAN